MTDRFSNASDLIPTYLDSDAPGGLFRPIGSSEKGLFLVGETAAGRYAAVLSGEIAPHPFYSWSLEEGAKHWSGICLGPVELQVVQSTAFNAAEENLRVGDAYLTGDGAYLRAAGKMRGFHLPLRIGGVATPRPAAPEIGFRHWRLIQRDKLGAEIVMFERSSPAEQA